MHWGTAGATAVPSSVTATLLAGSFAKDMTPDARRIAGADALSNFLTRDWARQGLSAMQKV